MDSVSKCDTSMHEKKINMGLIFLQKCCFFLMYKIYRMKIVMWFCEFLLCLRFVFSPFAESVL